MQKCPISVVVRVGEDGKFHLIWIRSAPTIASLSQIEKINGLPFEVTVERSTGKILSKQQITGPPLKSLPWQRSIMDEFPKMKSWQYAVLLEAQRQFPKQRGVENRRWLATAADLLVRYGERWYAKARQKFTNQFKGDSITLGELRRFLHIGEESRRWSQRAVRSGTIPPSCVCQTKGRQYRIRLCHDLYWWLVLREAMLAAERLCKKFPVGSEAPPFTPETFRNNGKKKLPMRKEDVRDLALATAIKTHSGMDLKQIAKSPHPLWVTPLNELPEELFKIKAKGRELEVAFTVGDLASRGAPVTPDAVASIIGVSRATIYREPCRSFYKKYLAQIVGNEPPNKGKHRSRTPNFQKLPDDCRDDAHDDDSQNDK